MKPEEMTRQEPGAGSEGSSGIWGERQDADHGDEGRRRKRDGWQELALEANGTWHEAGQERGADLQECVRQEAAAWMPAGTANMKFAA